MVQGIQPVFGKTAVRGVRFGSVATAKPKVAPELAAKYANLRAGAKDYQLQWDVGEPNPHGQTVSGRLLRQAETRVDSVGIIQGKGNEITKREDAVDALWAVIDHISEQEGEKISKAELLERAGLENAEISALENANLLVEENGHYAVNPDFIAYLEGPAGKGMIAENSNGPL